MSEQHSRSENMTKEIRVSLDDKEYDKIVKKKYKKQLSWHDWIVRIDLE